MDKYVMQKGSHVTFTDSIPPYATKKGVVIGMAALESSLYYEIRPDDEKLVGKDSTIFRLPAEVKDDRATRLVDNPRLPRCHRCRGVMRPGSAFRNTLEGRPDFPGDTGTELGTTLSYSGPARLVRVWKCVDCGHSTTRLLEGGGDDT